MINHHVETKTGAALKAMVSSPLPQNSFLDLAAINLFSNSLADLKAIFSVIEPTVSDLDLSDNELVDGAEQSFSEIRVSSLHLWFNDLFEKTGSELKTLFSAFSEKISFVDLSYNKLGYKRDFELNEAFSGFRQTLTAVRLSNNFFPNQDCAKLKKAFSGLPSTLTKLDFSDDKSLKHLSTSQLIAFLKTIPQTIKTVDLSHNKLFKGKTLAERDALNLALKEIDPDGSRLILANNGNLIIEKALPVASEVPGPRETVKSILKQTAANQVKENKVSKYSFFRQVRSIQEAAPLPAYSPKLN